MSKNVTYVTGIDYGEDFKKIGIITLNKPPLNALNLRMQEELAEIVDHAQNDKDINSVIIYGGEKVFAAGADVKEMSDMSYKQMQEKSTILQNNLGSLSTLTKPCVAAITGYALGGGLEVALAADYRIAGDNVKVGFPEILLGIIPGGGGTQRLVRLVGTSKAKDIIFTGRFVDAKEALSIGIVNKLVPPDQVLHEALLWAKQFNNSPQIAIAAAKKAIDEGFEMTLKNGLKLEAELFAELFNTEDRKIGMNSFIESGPGKARFTSK